MLCSRVLYLPNVHDQLILLSAFKPQTAESAAFCFDAIFVAMAGSHTASLE